MNKFEFIKAVKDCKEVLVWAKITPDSGNCFRVSKRQCIQLAQDADDDIDFEATLDLPNNILLIG